MYRNKIDMKTERQIVQWLKRHKWYESFRRQALLAHDIDNLTQDELLHSQGRWTILGAFDWFDSDEGPEFWQNVHREFEKWLES